MSTLCPLRLPLDTRRCCALRRPRRRLAPFKRRRDCEIDVAACVTLSLARRLHHRIPQEPGMHCPACKIEELAPTQLENGLTGLGTPNYARVDIKNCFKGDR